MRPSSPRPALVLAGVATLLGLLCSGWPARAQDAGSPDAGDGGAESPLADPRTAQVRALLDQTLDIAVEPQSLFPVPLGDDTAVRLEAAKLTMLLKASSEAAPPAPPIEASAKPRGTPTAAPPAASASSSASAAGASAIPPSIWEASVALDRARLDFYSLPRQRRDELLRAHQARKDAVRTKESDEERRAREAEQERQTALEAARVARSESERVVGEELARLIGVESAVSAVQDRFRGVREDIASRRDAALGWQRRVRDAKAATPADADVTYDALRRALRVSRDDLAAALDALDAGQSAVPEIGPDPLPEIPPEIPTEKVRERRASVEKQIAAARVEEQTVREELASELLDESTSLNQERLGLLPFLSADKRTAITGFTEAGLEQARSEARHLVLVLRYHRHVAVSELLAVRKRQGVSDMSIWRGTLATVPWVLAVMAFVWFRRRSPKLLALADGRFEETERAAGLTEPSLARRGLTFLGGVHRELEWLGFFVVGVWLLPPGMQGLLEVQLLTVIVGWTLGGALIVNAINTLAASADAPEVRAADQIGKLRLLSLRLVGRVVVAFALILVLSSRLVGEGTVYSWVLSTCWLAAIPVFFILVRWWRETIFVRVERVRRKSRMQEWVLANRRGWKSFFAAMLAAVQLFALGSYKTTRNWLAGFNVARRAHAYLFKRELDRMVSGAATVELRPLGAAPLESLSPDRAGEVWIDSPADAHLAAIRTRTSEKSGGVIALVGPRGMGKSSVFRRLAGEVEGSVIVGCTAGASASSLRTAVDNAVAASPEPSKEGAAAPAARPTLVMLDDAHVLIKSVLGGLKTFDEVLALARERSDGTLWVFAIDGVVWPFLRRARDARPLFDEVLVLDPWSDDQIGDVLASRSAEAGLETTFEDLLEKLPPSADEIDKQEALTAKQVGYFRMIWDYARGNPAMALEVWRASLAEGADGTARVRPLQAPDSTQLDALPDSTLFILKAVLQMSPARVADVAEATRLSEAQVQNVLRFAQAHGYLTAQGGGFRVAWPWLRAVMRLLERRHLLVNS
jgi:hypothetical protein